jgi:hypothetical protein
MDVVLRFEKLVSIEEWVREAERVIDLFSRKPGFQSAKAGLALDNDSTGLLFLSFDSVGSYRWALSAYDIKLEATTFLSAARDESSAFEILIDVTNGKKTRFQSEKTASIEEVSLGESATARAQSRLEQ